MVAVCTSAAIDCDEVICTEHGWGDGRLTQQRGGEGEEDDTCLYGGSAAVVFRVPSCSERGCHAHYCPAHFVEATLPSPKPTAAAE